MACDPVPADTLGHAKPFLEFDKVSRTFSSGGRVVRAVNGVSFQIGRGETLGLVGESGSGKSTIGRIATGLDQPQQGRVYLEGQDVTRLPRAATASLFLRCQMVFQDPYSSLNPRLSVGRQVQESLGSRFAGDKQRQRAEVARLFEMVGLDPAFQTRYPHEFSGGQRQRVAIARALAPNPQMIVADEAVSALDVTIQAQILTLLKTLKRDTGLGLLFISHDIAVVANICTRITVMYRGQIVEIGTTQDIVSNAQHPYTKSLLSAVPRLTRRRRGIVTPPQQSGYALGNTYRALSPVHLVLQPQE